MAALLGLHLLVGGTRLVFALPCYGLVALAAMLSLTCRPMRGARWPRWCLGSAALLAGYTMLRARWSPVEYLWWPDYFEVLACLLVYGLVAGFLHREEWLSWIFGALLLLAVAGVLVGFRQFSGADNFMPLGLTRAPLGQRASGFLVSPNHFAGFLEVIGLLSLALACWSEWRGWLRGVLAYLALMCLAGIIFSVSRGGYISVAVGGGVLALGSLWVIGRLDRRRALLTGVVGVVLVIGAVGGLLTVLGGGTLFQARLTLLEKHLNGSQRDVRSGNWQAAWEQSKLQPLTGTGAGTHLYYGRLYRIPSLQSDPVHAHCDYLELLAEYGWLGAIAMTLFVGAHLWRGVERLRLAVREEVEGTGLLRHHRVGVALGLLAALAAMLVHSLVDFNLHIPANALLLATIFGALAAPRTVAAEPEVARLAWPRLVLPGLGLLLLVEAGARFSAEYWGEKVRRAFVQGQITEVLALETKAAQRQRNPDTYFYLGESNRAAARAAQSRTSRLPFWQKAEANFRQSLALFPQNEAAWLRLAQTLDAEGRFEEAETAYLTAIQLDPYLGVLHAFYAMHLRQRGNPGLARAIVEKAREFSVDSGHTIDALPGIKSLLEEGRP